jgi:hypothetical protein
MGAGTRLETAMGTGFGMSDTLPDTTVWPPAMGAPVDGSTISPKYPLCVYENPTMGRNTLFV